ncbi:DivIVA domain-containing protein [bacterium]|nr:DivIVA domain-containing protein [bacterium]
MNINSEYIQKKEFHTVFKGYNMEEVDKFLDILAVEYERLLKKNIELQDSLDKVKYEGEGEIRETNATADADVSKLVSEVLISAHKIADEIKKKAEREAEEVIQNKKDIEENDIKNLLKEKKDIEERVKFAGKSYDDFILKVKGVINDFNLKIVDIENEFKAEDIKENLQTDRTKEEDIKKDFRAAENISINQNDLDKVNSADSSGEGVKETNEESNPEIRKLADDAEEQKIREIIESRDFEETSGNDTFKEVKKDKKIFDDYEEEKIIKDRKKTDIANPDIINEFFGNNDERKY